MRNTTYKTILLVEDEAIVAVKEKKDLESRGYRVINVYKGEEAVTKALSSEAGIDLILMDIDLGPGIDGTEAARRILEKRDIPVVFLSSHNEPEIVEKTENITSYGYIGKNSAITVLDASIKMAFKLFDAKMSERRYEEQLQSTISELEARNKELIRSEEELLKTEATLRQNEKKYKQLVDVLPNGIVVHKKGIIVFANDSTLKILMLDKLEDIIGTKVIDFIHPDYKEQVIERIRNSLTHDTVAPTVEEKLVRSDGTPVDCEIAAIPILYDNEPAMQVIIKDITDRKQAEEKLVDQKRRLKDIIDGTNVGTWEWNVQAGETVFNERWAEIIGYTLDEISPVSIETWIKYAHPEDLEESNRRLEKHFKGESEYYEIEIRMKHKNGSWVWVFDRGKVSQWTEDGRPLWMFGTHQDITDRKRAEEKFRHQLKEKEILLKEVHHRIKNNISSIESLLSLQADSVETPECSSILKEAIGRVRSTRIIYDKLLLTDNYTETSVKTYLEDLIEAVVAIFTGETPFTILKHIDDFSLDAKTLFSLGIIVTELFTNAIKYVFNNQNDGIIEISLSKSGDTINLTVQDNGPGLPGGFDLDSSTGFGFMLIKLLAEQHNGTFSVNNQNGARCTVVIQG